MSGKQNLGNYRIIYMLIIVAVVLAIVALYVIVRYITKLRHKEQIFYEQLVSEYSRCYRNIKSINDSFRFDMTLQPTYNYDFWVDSKFKYDHFNYDNYIRKIVSSDKQTFELMLSGVANNRSQIDNYRSAIESSRNPSTDEEIKSLGAKRHLYLEVEQEMCDMEVLNPITDFLIIVKKHYSSPAGRNSYSDYQEYNSEKIVKVIDDLAKILEHQRSRAYQRSIMTSSLRYDVMKRDGFRCVLCGRTSSEGVRLEVDHIVPISKGGRTNMSNLRTLCMDCNRGKRDKFDLDRDN